MSEHDPDDDPVARAAEVGCNLYVPDEREVLLDIDRKEDFKVLHKQLAVLNDMVPNVGGAFLRVVKQTVSKSGGWHVFLEAERSLSNLERIFLQAVLGSDRTREAISFARLENGSQRPPSVLFEVEGAREEVYLQRNDEPEPIEHWGMVREKHASDCKYETHYAPCTCGARARLK